MSVPTLARRVPVEDDGRRVEPLSATVSYEDDGEKTAIFRVWTEEDARACRLCPVCTAMQGPPAVIGHDGEQAPGAVCVVRVAGIVESESAPLFSTHGL